MAALSNVFHEVQEVSVNELLCDGHVPDGGSAFQALSASASVLT